MGLIKHEDTDFCYKKCGLSLIIIIIIVVTIIIIFKQ